MARCPAPFGTGTTGGITVDAFNGLPPSPVTHTQSTVPIPPTGFPPKADQPSNPGSLATNDNRMLSIVWRNGLLWTALNNACTPTGDSTTRSCARLDEIAVSDAVPSLTLLQDFNLAIPGAYVFYPAVSLDANSNLVLVYGSSSSTLFPSLFVSGQLSSGPADTLGQAATLASGTAADLSGRYGDYFSAASVPNSPMTFWVSGEYRQITLGQGWSTELGLIQFG